MQIRNICITLVALVELTACGPRYRQQVLGTGVAALQTTRANEPVPVAIAAADEKYEIRYVINLPSAMELSYRVDCPGDYDEGTVGETFEMYRRRRIAAMRRAREQQRRAISSLGQSVGGAVLGRAGVGAQVGQPVAPPPGPPPPPPQYGQPNNQPNGQPSGQPNGQPDSQPNNQPYGQPSGQISGQVEAHVDGQQVGHSVGQAVANAVVDDDIQLAPGDVGARAVTGDFQFVADSTGACTMKVWSELENQDIRGVTAEFTVVQLIDIAKEKQAYADARAQAREDYEERLAEAALQVRESLGQQMVARGADPELQARLAAERRAEEERRRQAEAVAAGLRAAKEAELAAQRAAKRRAREAARAAERREREAARAAERRARELRLREQQLEARRLRAEAERVRTRRIRAALSARRSLLQWCVGLGADPALRARLVAEAEAARLAAEAEENRRRARLAAEAEARRRRQLAVRDGSLGLRVTLLGFLQAQGADPEYQMKLEAARERELAARARARRLALEARLERRQRALDTRVYLSQFLRAQGALTVEERQPPPAPVEQRPPIPYEGAIWVAGRYVSVHGTWQWRGGYWKRPARGWALPTLPAGISIDVGAGIKVKAGTRQPPRRDRARDRNRRRDTTRDDERRRNRSTAPPPPRRR